MCAKYHCVKKQKLKIWSNLEHLSVFKALFMDNPEPNARTIHSTNGYNLPFFEGHRGDDPEQNTGMIHASNPEYQGVTNNLVFEYY